MWGHGINSGGTRCYYSYLSSEYFQFGYNFDIKCIFDLMAEVIVEWLEHFKC